MTNPADTQILRAVAGAFATGVTVVTTKKEKGEVHGMTANSFVCVSFEPPLVLFSVDKRATLYSMLKIDRLFGISILCDRQQSISNHFAGFSSLEDENVFEEADGVPLIKDCLAWYTVRVTQIIPAGDHKLVLCAIKDLYRNHEKKKPLVYFSGKYFSGD